MLARAAVVTIAAVVIAWLGVMLADAYRLEHGSSLPKGDIADLVFALKQPRQFASRIDQLRSARFLNPDTLPDLKIAGDYQLRSAPGDLAVALRIARSVVRKEPENLGAWNALYKIQVFRHDRAGQQQAIAHMRRLDPLDLKGS
jgi:hypothetical protein